MACGAAGCVGSVLVGTLNAELLLRPTRYDSPLWREKKSRQLKDEWRMQGMLIHLESFEREISEVRARKLHIT